ncbi:MAG: hypothetical protein ABRQ25_14615 [Clostridiaceae bacterium]
MAIIPRILILFVILGLITILIAAALRKSASGLKLMLLGIIITLFGGIIAADPDSNIGGFEYLISLIGLILAIIGFGKKD